MKPTEQFINILSELKMGDLGLLRTHAGQNLDESLSGFDLFTGIWWTLRQQSPQAPRREIAWLIAKLYAFCPVTHSKGYSFAYQLQKYQPSNPKHSEQYVQRVDHMLRQPIQEIESSLQWALLLIKHKMSQPKLDWVQLTDDLSIWHKNSVRTRWAEQFLNIQSK